MAGMDWFRWHHGSVTDPKFQLVAKKAGVKPADVLALWACLLEEASQAEDRGNPGAIDFDALDCLLGFEDGTAARIYARMTDRGLFAEDGRVQAWERRQPKRERDDDNSTARVQAFRDRKRRETPGNATDAEERQETPREDKSREEEKKDYFGDFWAAYPRRVAKPAARKAFAKLNAGPELLALILAAIKRQRLAEKCAAGKSEYVPHPATWLNEERWSDEEGGSAVGDKCPPWCSGAGFPNVYEAGNAGCYEHNAAQFRDGKRLEAA